MTPARAQALNAGFAAGGLELEPLLPGHAPAVFAGLSDPCLYRWISTPRPGSVEAVRARHERLCSRLSPDGDEAWLNWAIIERGSGETAGVVDASYTDDDHVGFGYVVFTSFQRRGIATRAVGALVDALSARGARQFRATVSDGHAASVRVLMANGFAQTGRIRDADMLESGPVDDLVFERRA